VSIVGGLSDLGLTTLGVRELAVRKGREQAQLQRNLLGVRIAVSAAGLAAAVVFAGVADYTRVMVLGTLLAGIGLLIQNIQTTLALKLMVELRLGWVALLELGRQAVVAASITALVLAGARLLAFLAVPIAAALVTAVVTVWLVRRDVPMLPAFDWVEWRTLLRHALPLAAAVAAAVVYFRLALVMLSLISNATETGYFAAPFRVTEVLIVVPQLIVTAALPILARAARDDRERLAYATRRTFEATFALGAWIALMLTLAGSFVIEVVAGPKFAPAAGVLRVQAFTLLMVFAYTTWGAALVALRRHGALIASTAIALVVNAAGVAVLGAAHGARGAALATVIADGVALVANGWFLSRTGTPVRPSLGVIPRVALAAAPASLLWFAPVPDLAKAALATVVYGVMLLVLRAVPEELLVELRRLRRTPAA
jgi:O-antigen/teichoic acid export membrane protein